MQEEIIDFHEEHINFLNFNNETKQIMKIFSTKFKKDPVTRNEQVIVYFFLYFSRVFYRSPKL